MSLTIELRPHVGLHIKTHRPVALGQDLIMLDGEHVGYVGAWPGAPVNLIRHLPETAKAAICEHVAAVRGRHPQSVSEPPEFVVNQLGLDEDEELSMDET